MAEYSKYSIPAVILVSLVVSFFILKPFIIPLIASAIVAYTFYPVFRWTNRFIKNKTAAAIIVAFIILLIITVPIILIINALSQEAYDAYTFGKEFLTRDLSIQSCTGLCDTLRNWLTNDQVHASVQKALEEGTNFLIVGLSGFLISIPNRLLEWFIIFFTTFYLLRDGDKLINSVKKLLATKQEKRHHILHRFKDVMDGVIYGSLSVAVVQGIVGAIGFAIFGISSPIAWGVLMFLFALIPYIGTGLIWGPAAAFLVLEGLLSGTSGPIWRGVGLLIYGLVFIASIDNILKPKMIGHSSSVHPVLVLVGILGGIALMGLPGVIVGPVVLAMAMTLLELYVHEPVESESS
jgi:predicted PurR-regulated permease PerM